MPNLARLDAANLRNSQPDAVQTPNGDESYADFRGNFSKGLPHDNLGEVDPAEYTKFKNILNGALGGTTDIQNQLEALTMGAPAATRRKFVNPQGGLSVEMEGADPRKFSIPAAPKFNSAEIAAEITENYWMALLRDVAFENYDTSPLADEAAEEMTSFSSEFKGPNDSNGKVTPQVLFRGLTPGDLAGPYISQFLFLPVPFGALGFNQRMRTPVANVDFMTDFNEWLTIQNGVKPTSSLTFDNTPRYIRNGRDLSQWVHIDVLFEAYFNAALILLQGPNADSPASDPPPVPVTPGLGAPLSQSNPYRLLNNQEGFGTFGGPHIATLVCEVATRALKAVWFQKWIVHRRLRPEVFAGRIHVHKTGMKSYDIHADALNSDAVARVQSQFGSYLLPMAFPEGSPLHPAYGAGHATVAGACVTILKALFDESTLITNPVVPNNAGTNLIAYTGPDAGSLTVGGELNKLASNVAIGRNIAGVHWRSDGTESLKLGENVAIEVLKDQKATFNEHNVTFQFHDFAGNLVTI